MITEVRTRIRLPRVSALQFVSGFLVRGFRGMSRHLLVVILALIGVTQPAYAQDDTNRLPVLRRDYFKNGDRTMAAFAPVAEATRYSIAKFDLNGNTIALGAIIDRNGLAVTKASEIKDGKLTCWLPQ